MPARRTGTGGHVGIEPLRDGCKRRVGEIALQISPHPGLVSQITWLAVALPQPGKDAQDLGVTLRPEQRIGCAIERHGGSVAIEHRSLQRLGDVAARILQHRNEIVGRVPGQRILEVEQAKPAARQQHHVFSVIITQYRHRLHRRQRRKRLLPGGTIGIRVDRQIDRRRVPFGEKRHLAQIFRHVVGAQRGGGRVPVERGGQIDRLRIYQLLARGIGGDHLCHAGISEILNQDEPLIEIARQDGRRGEAQPGEMPGDVQERPGILVRRRRVHQHCDTPRRDRAEVTAERCVAGQRQDFGIPPAIGGEECGRARRWDHGWNVAGGHRDSHAAGCSQVKRRPPAGSGAR
jgi:hypothetical protein